MYELFAFTETLNPVIQGILSGVIAFLAIFLFRSFYLWLTGVNLILEELRTLNANLNKITDLQTKGYEVQRRINVNTEISNNKLSEIQTNTEQLVITWEQ